MKLKLLLAAVLIASVGAFFYFDLGQFLSFEYIKAQQSQLNQLYLDHQWLTLVVFFAIYVAVTGLSLPGAVFLTLIAGALFGLVVGTLLVSFASTLGATLAFLSSRFLFRDALQQRFASSLEAINRGIEKEGGFYLFTLRLVPAFPFFVINLVMGLTRLPTWTFYWVSQLGMLAGTLVYVNAGTSLASLESPSDILSLRLILSFALLGLFPLVAKKALAWIKERR